MSWIGKKNCMKFHGDTEEIENLHSHNLMINIYLVKTVSVYYEIKRGIEYYQRWLSWLYYNHFTFDIKGTGPG